MLNIDLTSIFLTLKVATVTTLVLLVIGTPLAWWMSRMKSSFKVIAEALVALPLVLPPTVLGFYLLVVLSPTGALTNFLRSFGFSGQLTFNFTGLVIGSVIYSLPFTVQPLVQAFSSIPTNLLDAAKTMRANFLDRFFTIVVPLSRNAFLVATTLTFAHTVGEFGVVLMVGGNIPGSTRVVSIDIYNYVESLEYDQAHALSAIMLLFAITVLILVYSVNRKIEMRKKLC